MVLDSELARLARLRKLADGGELPADQARLIQQISILQACVTARAHAAQLMDFMLLADDDQAALSWLRDVHGMTEIQAHAVVDMQIRHFNASRGQDDQERLRRLIELHDAQFNDLG